MSKNQKIVLNITRLIDKFEINTNKEIDFNELRHKVTESVIAALQTAAKMAIHPNDIQRSSQRPSYKLSSPLSSVSEKVADRLVPTQNTGRKRAITELILRQIRVVDSLVRAQDRNRPILLRKSDLKLVDSLICQTEILLNTLYAYVFPLLGLTDSNKYSLP